jgi:hypothetical protein
MATMYKSTKQRDDASANNILRIQMISNAHHLAITRNIIHFIVGWILMLKPCNHDATRPILMCSNLIAFCLSAFKFREAIGASLLVDSWGYFRGLILCSTSPSQKSGRLSCALKNRPSTQRISLVPSPFSGMPESSHPGIDGSRVRNPHAVCLLYHSIAQANGLMCRDPRQPRTWNNLQDNIASA